MQEWIEEAHLAKGDAFMSTIKRPDEPIRADHVAGPPQGQWTYKHYAEIPDDGQRYEILDGVLYMSPAPSEPHQRSVLRLGHYLLTYVEFVSLGIVLTSPFDVELSFSNVVQPDALVLLKENRHKSISTRIIGAPDLVVEVASPGTSRYDRKKKSRAYAQAGVREYWIVHPLEHTVEVFVLEADTYCSVGVFSGEQTIPSQVISHFPVRVQQFFAE
jgi:Uma2 family endonuclease